MRGKRRRRKDADSRRRRRRRSRRSFAFSPRGEASCRHGRPFIDVIITRNMLLIAGPLAIARGNVPRFRFHPITPVCSHPPFPPRQGLCGAAPRWWFALNTRAIAEAKLEHEAAIIARDSATRDPEINTRQFFIFSISLIPERDTVSISISHIIFFRRLFNSSSLYRSVVESIT